MNILYVIHKNYEVCLNLDKATSIQRFRDYIIIHFSNPDENFTIYDDSEEFAIIDEYFNMLRKQRMKLIELINQDRVKNGNTIHET